MAKTEKYGLSTSHITLQYILFVPTNEVSNNQYFTYLSLYHHRHLLLFTLSNEKRCFPIHLLSPRNICSGKRRPSSQRRRQHRGSSVAQDHSRPDRAPPATTGRMRDVLRNHEFLSTDVLLPNCEILIP